MRLLLVLIFLAQPALAAPKVAATIPPLAGLVAEIMQGVGKPVALMQANAEPHHFSLRPSQISALREADIVFAVGLELEPWLARIDGDFVTIKLADATSEPLSARNFDFTIRTEPDPHLWLDPGEMILWELEITQTLIRQDPANIATYRANEFAVLKTLVAAKERLAEIGAQMNETGIRLVVTHDAFQYLEMRLGVEIAGMLSDYTEAPAGARTLSKIARLTGPICLIETAEFNAPTDLLPSAPRVQIEPMGAVELGMSGFPARYYQNIVSKLETCLIGW